jgi:hypothetical protein
MPSLRDTVAQVEAEWNNGGACDSSSDDGSDDSDEDRPTKPMLPVTELATAPAIARCDNGPLSVLLIHGLWSTTGWFFDAIVGRQLPSDLAACVPRKEQDENRARALAAWREADVEHRSFAHGEDADQIAACQTALA